MNAKIDISETVLTTERIKLRPWRQSDLDDLFAYASVDGVGQMAGWKPHEDRAESQRILDRFISNKRTFALEYRGRAVGSVGIELYDEERFPEFAALSCWSLGYVLAKEYWGMGLMPEAVNEALRHLFEEVGLDAVFCSHFLSNRQSGRVQEKCGFRHFAFGSFKTQFGTVEEDETNIMTREDWFARKAKKQSENEKEKKMIVLNVTYYVKPGLREEFLEAILAEGIDEASRAEDGNIKYDYYIPFDGGDELLLVEKWRSAAALKAHAETPHFKRLGELKGDFVDETVIERFEA